MSTAVTIVAGRIRALGPAGLMREDGQGVTEYGIVLAFVAVVLGVVLVALGGQIATFIDSIGTALSGLPGSFS